MTETEFATLSRQVIDRIEEVLAACRTWGVESENRPQRGQFLPPSCPIARLWGKKAVKNGPLRPICSPTIPKSDRLLDGADIDFDLNRKGDGIFEVGFENGTKLVINSQALMRQNWVAARSGGFHFSQQQDAWIDTRSGPFFTAFMPRSR